MIDCENQVIDEVTSLVDSQFPGIDISSDWSRAPASFPYFVIYAGESHDLESTWDSGNNVVQVFTFVAQAYSNKTGGGRTQCKKILAIVDDYMKTINAKRESRTALPNIEDTTIYRMGATYIVATDGKHFFRR